MSFLLVFTGPVSLGLAAWLGGPWVALPAVILFVLVPVLDQLVSQDHDNTPGPAWLERLPYAYVPAHLVSLAYALWVVVNGGLGPVEAAVLTLGAGMATAAAINVAHELMHRAGRVPQAIAAVLMATATYTHFCVEHVQGHHKWVGTPKDSASSKLGESLYAFLPRTLWGSLRSAWGIEVARVGVGPRNRLVRYAFAQVALFAGLGAWLGWAGLGAFVAQSAVAVLMLETINYLEHYGLSLQATAPGRYERVMPHHSWNSSHRVSNRILLNLARHSDHHAFAARSFPTLRHHDDVPQLPAGYSAMLILATLPPLWFRVMDPRVRAAKAGAVEAAAG